MEGKARDFQDHLVQVIRDFRSVIMDCFGAPKTDECLVQARESLALETEAKSLMVLLDLEGICIQKKTRLSKLLFICEKKNFFWFFGSCNSIAEMTSSKKGNLSSPTTLSCLFQCYIQVWRSHPYQD